MEVFCLVLLAMFNGIFAVSCENMVRLADLQDIIKNQTKLIADLKNTIAILNTGISFMVSMTYDAGFKDNQIIKFDKIITKVGGGYIGDIRNADYGKFIAPGNGTYQFNVNVYNHNALIGADLEKNGALIISTKENGGSASLSAVLDLMEGDAVYLMKPGWVADATLYNRYFTSFSGVLIRADN